MSQSSKLLIDEAPLQVLPSLALKIGLNEAIVLQQVHWLCNHDNNVTKEYDHVWIKRTAEEWHDKTFKFWSIPTIRRILKNLIDGKYLKTTTDLSEDKRDRTLWYAVDYDSLNASDQVDHMTTDQVDQITSDQVDHMILIENQESIQNNTLSAKADISPVEEKSEVKKKKNPQNLCLNILAFRQDNLLPEQINGKGSYYAGILNGSKSGDRMGLFDILKMPRPKPSSPEDQAFANEINGMYDLWPKIHPNLHKPIREVAIARAIVEYREHTKKLPPNDGIPRDAQGQPLPPSLPPRLPPITTKEPEYDF